MISRHRARFPGQGSTALVLARLSGAPAAHQHRSNQASGALSHIGPTDGQSASSKIYTWADGPQQVFRS